VTDAPSAAAAVGRRGLSTRVQTALLLVMIAVELLALAAVVLPVLAGLALLVTLRDLLLGLHRLLSLIPGPS
jgi:hypothetical protein